MKLLTRNVALLGNFRTQSWQDVKITRPSPERSQRPYPGEAVDSKGENDMEPQTHKSESYIWFEDGRSSNQTENSSRLETEIG